MIKKEGNNRLDHDFPMMERSRPNNKEKREELFNTEFVFPHKKEYLLKQPFKDGQFWITNED